MELVLSPVPVPPATLLATLEPSPPPLTPAKAAPPRAKSSKKAGRR